MIMNSDSVLLQVEAAVWMKGSRKTMKTFVRIVAWLKYELAAYQI
jgi:hypothetical protein